MTRAAPPVALYLHVPFCVSHCPYCDFVVYAGAEARGPRARVDTYLAALEREVELRADALDERFGPARPALESVYVGGGTPSLVPPTRIARLLEVVARRFGIAGGAEITLEANPAADERGDLAAFRAGGITRLSLGAQAASERDLARLGRRHDWRDVAEAVDEARRAGIASIGLDLLYDVPGQSVDGWTRALRCALDVSPDHLSLYALTLDDPDSEGLTGVSGDHLPTAAGARRWRMRALAEQDDDRAADEYGFAWELLRAGGWRGYEISNWAQPGHESRHNLAYWRRRPYEAAGVGAHAFDGETRRWNAARLDGYLAALLPVSGTSQLPPGGRESIDEETAAAERVILALRLDAGVPEEWATREPLAEARDWALAAGLLEPFRADGESRLRLTLRGRLLSNELFARLV